MQLSRAMRLCAFLAGLVVLGTACGPGNDDDQDQEDDDTEDGLDTEAGLDTDGNNDTADTDVIDVGLFVSKSGTTALASDGSWFASTNRDSGSLTVYAFAGDPEIGTASKFTLSLGGENPEVSSVVRGHDDTYVLATLQYDQQICRIEIDGGATQTPDCAATGSEPTGVVTNAAGSRVYVANMVDGSLTVYDSALTLIETLDFSDANGETQVHPFALLYLRPEDAPGSVYVTDFFAEKVPGGQEGSDTGRQGAVYKLAGDATDTRDALKITLPPLEETGFRIPSSVEALCPNDDAAGCANDTSGAFPNQLTSLFYQEGRLFVPSTCASPRGNIRFNMNLHSCVHVIDTETDEEIPELRLNIQERIKQQPAGEDKLFCTVPTDFACVPGTEFCYVTCGSSDLMMRLDYKDFSSASLVEAGVPGVKNLPTGKFPTGVSIYQGPTVFAFVNNENSYSVTTISLTDQAFVEETQSVPLPVSGSIEATLLEGKDFFFTGRGRWSDARWSSCVGCHPRGLTDNVTWHFPTGPRQTVSMDASFSKENVDPDAFGNSHGFAEIVRALEADENFPQRIFNWTSVRDEVADFELNTRGVSGGLGAIVDEDNNPVDLTGENEDQDDLVIGGIGDNANNLGSTEALIDELNTNRDWEEITEWVKTIRSPRGKTNVPGDVSTGKGLFEANYNCDACHAGGSWTTSLRYYTPTFADNAGGATSDELKETLVTNFLEGKNNLLVGQTPVFDIFSSCLDDSDCLDIEGACDTTLNQCVSPALEFEFYASDTRRGINQHACVLRNVDTYEGQDAAEGALEVRKDMVTPSQGLAGINVPSVLNTQLGAPYLHNGRFESLADFLLDEDVDHVRKGSAISDINEAEARDLIAYLLTIDGSTTTLTPRSADVLCEPF